MSRPAIIASASELLGIWPDLDDVAVIGLDLRDAPLDWSAARVRSTLFLGCLLPDGESDRLVARGAVVLSGFDDAPFDPYRADALHLRRAHGGPRARRSRDARCADRDVVHQLVDVVARRRHARGARRDDRCGGRALRHGPPSRRRDGRARARVATPIGSARVAELGRALTRAGFTVATGGGPGVMEAANLGAWMAPSTDDALDDALAIARAAHRMPRRDADAYVRGRARRPDIAGRTAARVSAFRRGCTSTSRPPASRRTSPSTSPTASAKTACSRSHAPASCTRPAAPAPNRRSSPTPRRTASRSTRCAARWSSSAATSSRSEHPELLAAVRRQADDVRLGELVTVSDDARRGRRLHRARTTRTRRARRRRTPPRPSGALTHAVADRPRARTALAVRGSLRADPRRVRDPGRVSSGRRGRSGRGRVAWSGAAARRAGHRSARRARRAVRHDRSAGILDLDQAFHAERRGNGYRVHYAIADVAAFVAPGSALDRESFVRGVTLYLPDGRAPMLPNQLGEGAASLLPDEERPALLWTIDLDATGATTSARLERATVRSRARLDYPSVQAALDRGAADEPLVLLREIGGASTRSRSRTRRHQPRPPLAGGRSPTARASSTSSTRRRCRSKGGTRRSRCSPAWKRRRSWSTPASASCARCRLRSRSSSIACGASPARSTSRGRSARRGAKSCAASIAPSRRRRVPDPGRARAARRRLREARRGEHCRRAARCRSTPASRRRTRT